jgi:ribonuclease D
MPLPSHFRILTSEGDLPEDCLRALETAPCVAIDTETTGLDFVAEQLMLVQVFVPPCSVYLIKQPSHEAPRLRALLLDEQTQKIFHHAAFDLGFLHRHLKIQAHSVACTKVAARILDPSGSNFSLAGLLQRVLNITIDKRLQTSDWSQNLSNEQIEYAVNDVVHLPDLLDHLQRELETIGRWPLAMEAFAFLPTLVDLRAFGAKDVFQY